MRTHARALGRAGTRVLVGVVLAACGGTSAGPAPRAAPASPPVARTDVGALAGMVDSATGVLVFRGVPYAAPPLGAARWRPPAPATPWSGVRRADRLGHNCMQGQPYGDIDPYAAGIGEDCLYLNIWTPSLGGRRPVMVWIHGGGFFAGFGGEERHRGARLATKGAVVVTLNYRLGIFGFLAHPALATESPHASAGNYGLLDQIAALEWVRRNIAQFGGDSTRVTIFGESAGGYSVASLIASPLARGLFQRAIMESGVGIGAGFLQRDSAAAEGVRFATSLGIPGRGVEAADRLRAIPADSVLAAYLPTLAPNRGFSGGFGHMPVIDGWVLPVTVDTALARGAANLVPVIVGSNADESDERFGAPARSFARLVTARGQRAYRYLFARIGQDTVNHRRVGAVHSAEITFVFGRPKPILTTMGHAPYDAVLADAMSDYWVAFATTGDPNTPPARGRWPTWPVYDPATDAYLELGPEIVAKRDLRRAVYDSLDDVARRRGEIRP